MLKTKDQILQDMISDVIAETDLVTYFGKDGAVRGILNAAANALVEPWTDLFQVKRGLFVTTAAGDDLDLLASKWSLTRLGASFSSDVLLINGPAGTTIPAGTIVVSSVNSNIQYQTLTDVILGTANPNIQRPINALSLGDIVIAKSTTSGSNTQVSSNELTSFLVPITGVTVTNLVPSSGGADAESDADFKARILGQLDLFAQGTQAFYEAAIKNINPNVIKSFAASGKGRNPQIYLVKNDYSLLTDDELSTIQTGVYNLQRAFNDVQCLNASILSIEIRLSVFVNNGYTTESIFSSVSGSIANYIQSIFDFGAVINYSDLVYEILKVDGVAGIDFSQYTINGATQNVRCASNQVPYFSYLTISDMQSSVARSVTQRYLVI